MSSSCGQRPLRGVLWLLVGLACAVSLCFVAVSLGSIRQHVDTISDRPGASCPSCTCACPEAPKCNIDCPETSACDIKCPDPVDAVCESPAPCPQCPACELECPGSAQDDDDNGQQCECPTVVCQACGDCINGEHVEPDTDGNGLTCESPIPTYVKFTKLPDKYLAFEVLYHFYMATFIAVDDIDQLQAAVDAAVPGTFEVVMPMVFFSSGSGVASYVTDKSLGDSGVIGPSYRQTYGTLVKHLESGETTAMLIDVIEEEIDVANAIGGSAFGRTGKIYSIVSRDNEYDTIFMHARETMHDGYNVKLSATFPNGKTIVDNSVIVNEPERFIYTPGDGTTPLRARISEYYRFYSICDNDAQSALPDCVDVYTNKPVYLVSRGVHVRLGEILAGEVRYNRQFAVWKPEHSHSSEKTRHYSADEVRKMSYADMMKLVSSA